MYFCSSNIYPIMNTNCIINFLKDLKVNNNREWFAENKDLYEQAKNEFEQIGTSLISQIGSFDNKIATLNAKDCIFRIYFHRLWSLVSRTKFTQGIASKCLRQY